MVCFTLVLHIITFDKCNGMWTYPSIYCLYHLSKTRSQGSLEPISEESGHKAGNTLDGVKIHRSAQSHIITYPFTHYGQFRAYQQCIYIILGPQIDTVLELLSVWGFTCSPNVHMGFLQVLWFHPTSKKHAGWGIGDSCERECLYPGMVPSWVDSHRA